MKKPQQMRKEPKAAASSTVHVVADVSVPIARVQILRFESEAGLDQLISDPTAHWVDLSLTDRAPDMRGCYFHHWNPHRQERVGPLFTVPQGEELRLKSRAKTHSSIVCRLDRKATKKWTGSELDWTSRRLEASLDISNAEIRRLMRKLAHEIRYPGLAFLPMIESLTSEIVIEIVRYFAAIDAPAAAGGLAAWRLRAIDERVTEPRQSPKLSELAKLCNMSLRQLTRAFRASRGCSLGDYILQTRIDTAKRLLATDESITTISRHLGFPSAAGFSFAFRRGAGVSPRQYRARMIHR